MKPICPYCDRPAELVTGAKIYPHRHDLKSLLFWECSPCDARVGCHPKGSNYGEGSNPLGRLANGELRKAKSDAHAAFDPIWKARHMGRREAYAWLATQLGITVDNCHIGMFDLDGCKAVLAAVDSWRMSA